MENTAGPAFLGQFNLQLTDSLCCPSSFRPALLEKLKNSNEKVTQKLSVDSGMLKCHTIIVPPPPKSGPRTVHGRIIGPPWDHPWRCKQSPLAIIGPTSCSLAQVTNIHWKVNYEARKYKQTRMESLHRPSGGHVVQVIVSGAHNAPERIYKSMWITWSITHRERGPDFFSAWTAKLCNLTCTYMPSARHRSCIYGVGPSTARGDQVRLRYLVRGDRLFSPGGLLFKGDCPRRDRNRWHAVHT